MSLTKRLEETDLRISEQIREIQDSLSRLTGQEEIVSRLEGEARALDADADLTLHARLLLESYSEEEQARLVSKIEGLVSRGLQVIFGPGYWFTIELGQSRGQVTTEFRIRVDGEDRDPLQSHGGGVVNVVAFVLRLVVVALTPGLSRVVIVDEPFAQLSAGYLDAVSDFLRELVDATGMQLVIVSHEEEVAAVADRAYRLRAERGKVVLDALR